MKSPIDLPPLATLAEDLPTWGRPRGDRLAFLPRDGSPTPARRRDERPARDEA